VSEPGLPEIVTGQVRFGIDMRVPGMLYATVARSPVHGGAVRRFSAERAMGMPGVRRVVQIPSGIAVVATSTWQAMQARATPR
jgi:isoquinoline 1-oxidoreductase beta subunit